jgi:hypothetical protein
VVVCAQFGKEGIKIVMLKAFVNWFNGKMMGLVGATKDQLVGVRTMSTRVLANEQLPLVAHSLSL